MWYDRGKYISSHPYNAAHIKVCLLKQQNIDLRGFFGFFQRMGAEVN